jgi:DNA polymerase III epsilon subunit-like protein
MATRPHYIAITDFEFTGLDPMRHEIIEIGLIVVDSVTLEEKRHFESKVEPEHIDTASPESLSVAGYKPEAWKNALSLKHALSAYIERVDNALFASWCTPYDWIFFLEALKKTNLKNPFGHRTLDLFSVAYEKMKHSMESPKMSLSGLSQHFGIPKEPMPHRAMNGAATALAVYKKLQALL